MNESRLGLRGRTASPADDADQAVLALVAAGQLDSLQDLYDRYKTMAYSIALRITSDASLAEDVVQDAFIGRLAQRGPLRGRPGQREDVGALDRPPPGGRRRPPPPPDDRAARARGRAAARSSSCPTSGTTSRPASIGTRSRAAMATLSDVQREAIELAYWGGLTQQEIAERTGTPLGTVKSRVRLGLLALRRALVGDEDGPARGLAGDGGT